MTACILDISPESEEVGAGGRIPPVAGSFRLKPFFLGSTILGHIVHHVLNLKHENGCLFRTLCHNLKSSALKGLFKGMFLPWPSKYPRPIPHCESVQQHQWFNIDAKCCVVAGEDIGLSESLSCTQLLS